MDKTKALQKLLNGTATKKEIELLKQALASGEISIGGDVNRSVVIIGSGNKVELTAEALNLLKPEITSEEPAEGEPPYMGLRYFDTDDAALFYGREALTRELAARVAKESFLAVVGASGSGKSSVARAGLIPAWQKENEGRGAILVITPTAHPLESLAASLTRESESVTATSTLMDDMNRDARSLRLYVKKMGETNFLLVVDQFEETFTLCKDPAERTAFIMNLLMLAVDDAARVVITLRADFYAHCAEYEGLRLALEKHQAYIGAMTPDELREAIMQPAQKNGWDFQPGLVDLILQDVGTEPGALPLLSHALLETWKRRQGRTLTLKGYADAGGVKKAIAQTAESVYDRLTPIEQTIARGIFLRLTELGEGMQDTRRRVKLDELSQAKEKQEAVAKVLKTLTDARLVTIEQDTAEVAHEALIREWGTLRKWLEEDRESLRLHRHLTESAQEWERSGRNELYIIHRGGRLDDALSLKENSLFGLSKDELSYLSTCVALRNKERRERERRLRYTVVTSIVAAIIFLFLGALGFVKSNEANANAQKAENNAATAQTNERVAATAQANAEEQAQIARAGEIAAQAISQREGHFDLSLLLSIEAFLTANTPSTRNTLFNNMQINPQLVQYLSGHKDAISSLAFSPNGRILASGSNDKTIILWDVKTGRPISPPLMGHSDSVRVVAFSPDGKILTSGSDDGQIILWNIETQMPVGKPLIHVETQELFSFDQFGQILKPEVVTFNTFITGLAFSPDGKILAAGYGDETIILWDLTTYQPIGQPIKGVSGIQLILKFSSDGKTLASLSDSGTFNLWNIALQKSLLRSLKVSTTNGTFAFSPDGKLLSASGDDGSITLWDLETYQPVGSLTGRKGTYINSMAFSPDSKIVASENDDKTIFLWDIKSQQQIGQTLLGHASALGSIVFSPNGKILASGDGDGTIIFWKIPSYQVVNQNLVENTSDETLMTARLDGVPDMTLGPDGVSSFVFSPNGKILASGSIQGTIYLWDLETHQKVGQLSQEGQVISLAFSPDGTILASSGFNGRIILWSMATLEPIGQLLKGSDYYINSIAFSPDGMLLASGGCAKQDASRCTQGDVTVWNVASLDPITQFFKGINNYGFDVAFSPNGKILASGNFDGTINLWNVENRQFVSQPLKSNNFVFKVLFISDSRLASFQNDTLVFWDLNTNEPIESMDYGYGTGVALGSDGKLLATGGNAGLVTLWDLETNQPLGSLRGHQNYVNTVAFSRDDKLLVSGSDDKTIILWDIDPQSWINKTCLRVGRNLTQAEWKLYFPNEEYRSTCPNFPIEAESAPTP